MQSVRWTLSGSPAYALSAGLLGSAARQSLAGRMKETITGALLAVLMSSLALASCKGPAGTAAVTPPETDLTPTPTPAPYWDHAPLTSGPDGGWQTYQSGKLGFSFQYPAVYDQSECGRIWLQDKYWYDPPYTAVGLGSINIHVFESWTGDLADQVSAVTSAPESQLLTAVEPLSVGGVPALRFIFRPRELPGTDYIKTTFVVFAGRLYHFSYAHLAHVRDCDAPPLSEEEVYDHLLSTVEFNP